ncbi:MAG TPA: enoyl-CoA hydratase-related protein [Acidimicrobiales bacterium]|nr:enoyl-CoA hydratase-related protein [Acidimicrobiales bacterium]
MSGTPDYEQIVYAVDGGVATVTLNRPEKLNAMTAQMGAEMADAMAEADEDDEVRAVVVTGAGTAFCAGADLGGGKDTKGFGDSWGGVERTYRRRSPQHVRKPVIAAINGAAVGAGLTWPLQCDVRFVAEDAKLAFAFVRRGVIPELASHGILPRLIGIEAAFDLLVTGRTFLGAEAAELGMARRALPAAEVLPAALAFAREIAVHSAPVSVAIAKRLIWEGVHEPLSRVAQKEGKLFAWVTRQADAREGVVAFFEKREPAWNLRVGADYPDWPQ